jgi:hypothetical protein
VNSTNYGWQYTMTKVGKSDGEGTFAGTRGNDKVAPIAVLRCSHAEWRGSTLTRPSRRRQQTVGSAEKRTFAPDFTRPK